MAATPEAWIVNDSGEVWRIDLLGNSELMSPAGEDFAQDISVRSGGTVWIISTEVGFQNGKPVPGGNVIKWLADPKTKTWKPVPLPAVGVQVCGNYGARVRYINAAGEIYFTDKTGSFNTRLSPAGKDFAFQISEGNDAVPWSVSTEVQFVDDKPVPGGNVVQWLDGQLRWHPVPAAPAGSIPSVASWVGALTYGFVYAVNGNGVVFSMEKNGKTTPLSPPGQDLAKVISAGLDGNSTVWIVSTKAVQGGGAVKWLADAKTMTWKTAPGDIGAARISGGFTT